MIATARRAPQRASLTSRHIAAPIGGINTVTPAGMMPPTDCVYAYNVMAAEQGLRARLGNEEHATGVLDASGAAGEVRTTIPFTGSAASGANNRLFVTTTKGIYDVSAGGLAGTANWAPTTAYVVGDRRLNDSGKTYLCTIAGTSAGAGGPTGTSAGIVDGSVHWDYKVAPLLALSFADTSGNAGHGIGGVSVTAAGHFCWYFDEVNGYHIYTESTDAWRVVIAAAVNNWQATHAYVIGDTVINDPLTTGKTFRCITAGTSAGAGGPTGTSADIVDGTVHWRYTPEIVSGVDPTKLVFGIAFKNRLWAVERDTARAWYLGLFSIFGAATSFNFGMRFKQGGPLIGLWSWSMDGGAGPDDRMVAVSTGGDVVIYAFSDPSNISSFQLVGVWSMGNVPAGRRIATDFGGDLLLMSTTGIISLSKLVLSNIASAIDATQYSTYKISNLFNLAMGSTSTIRGWSMQLHPEDNSLLVTVPASSAGAPTTQLAMSLATKGWFQYRDLPIFSAASWTGKMYFGTNDGRVCINTGYLDGVLLSDPSSYTAIQASFLGAFFNGGNGQQKKVELIRPTFLSLSLAPSSEVRARYRYDFTEGAPVPWAATTGGANTWDSAVWDSALWSDAPQSTQAINGTAGMGPEFALSVRFSSISRTTYVGSDVHFKQGGFL